MSRQDQQRLLCFARCATQASTVDIKSEDLPWRLAEAFSWDTPGQESGGLRLLSMAMLTLSLELRERADELDRIVR